MCEHLNGRHCGRDGMRGLIKGKHCCNAIIRHLNYKFSFCFPNLLPIHNEKGTPMGFMDSTATALPAQFHFFSLFK